MCTGPAGEAGRLDEADRDRHELPASTQDYSPGPQEPKVSIFAIKDSSLKGPSSEIFKISHIMPLKILLANLLTKV